MPNPSKNSLERAFEMASSGQFTVVSDIKRALDAEGHQSSQITGPTLQRQLRALIKDAQLLAAAVPAGGAKGNANG